MLQPPVNITTSEGIFIPRPLPIDIARGIVLSSDRKGAWEALLELEECMDPRHWLDIALWCAGRRPMMPPQALDAIMRNRIHFTQTMVPFAIKDWWRRSGTHLTLWRSCLEGVNEDGPAFSPDPFHASLYMKFAMPDAPQPILVEAVALKEDCVAFSGYRRSITLLALPGAVEVVKRYALPLSDDFYRERALQVLS